VGSVRVRSCRRGMHTSERKHVTNAWTENRHPGRNNNIRYRIRCVWFSAYPTRTYCWAWWVVASICLLWLVPRAVRLINHIISFSYTGRGRWSNPSVEFDNYHWSCSVARKRCLCGYHWTVRHPLFEYHVSDSSIYPLVHNMRTNWLSFLRYLSICHLAFCTM